MKYFPSLMTITKLEGVFFNILKGFNEVQQEGIIHKLKRNGI